MRRMGRAPTHPRRLLVAINDGLLDRIDRWRAVQPGLPNRSEAVRYLIDAGIVSTAPKPPPRTKKPPRR